MKFGKISVIVIGLVPFNVYAECTPTPDCDAIGYTEASCEGDSLKCPFDTSKMKCIPCDSSFRYDCSGDNITASIGSACGGKYVACECFVGALFNNGNCICNSTCTVGAIYYSDGTCSSCVDNSKTPIGVVVKDNELVMSHIIYSGTWASSYIDVENIVNMTSQDIAITDFNGKSNTLAIIETYPNDTKDNNAAINCNLYSVEGTNVGDWYLPAAGELYSYVSRNYYKINATMSNLKWTLGNGKWLWSSTEINKDKPWHITSDTGEVMGSYKINLRAVTCFLAIN